MANHTSPIPREILEAPFPPDAIKTRPGAYGGSLSYLEGHTIVQRLNEAFDGQWSFEVVTHQILDDEVLVLGKLKSEVAGVVKMAFGSSRITRDDRTGKPIALGDDLKAGATDALKKAATLLGVGLSLYSGQLVTKVVPGGRPPVRGGAQGPPRQRRERPRHPEGGPAQRRERQRPDHQPPDGGGVRHREGPADEQRRGPEPREGDVRQEPRLPLQGRGVQSDRSPARPVALPSEIQP